MAIGERIHFFRILRGMTQNILVRLSVFLNECWCTFSSIWNRNKKTEGGTYCCIGTGTWCFPSCPRCTWHWQLYRTDAHFVYPWRSVWSTVSEADGEICLKVNKEKGKNAHELLKMLYAWKEQADKLSSEEISREEYDNWRYHYPKFDTTQRWAKVPSQELSDALVEMFKDQLKPDK